MALRGDSEIMDEREALKARVQELAARDWGVAAIEARYRRLLQDGIVPRRLDPAALVATKASALDRVQHRAEEYEYLGHS